MILTVIKHENEIRLYRGEDKSPLSLGEVSDDAIMIVQDALGKRNSGTLSKIRALAIQRADFTGFFFLGVDPLFDHHQYDLLFYANEKEGEYIPVLVQTPLSETANCRFLRVGELVNY